MRGRTNEARADWEALLERPEKERRYRSTWAAYMLGRSWLDADDEKAIRYFQQVASFARSGFPDRPGLAASSLGWEARAELNRKHFDHAIELYLQQLATGDRSATISLREAAAKALNSDRDLICLATNGNCRRVITAFITSRRTLESLFNTCDMDNSAEANQSIITRWLDAVEAADVSDVDSAEQIALAAYQAGKWDIAQRWIRRAKTTPVTQWLQAKLLLRSGNIEAAAALLDRVARVFPRDEIASNRADTAELKDNLYMDGSTYLSSRIIPGSEVLAELGALRLARREYVESLDALLRAGFWMDAAYVAERVLTLDELKGYVDRNWPAVEASSDGTNSDREGACPRTLDLREEIRYLLARRLTRMERGNEAREYFPPRQRPDFDALLQNLVTEGGGGCSSSQRADALFAAAKLVRKRGMQLIGTEVEPDWYIHGGVYEYGVSINSRTNGSTVLLLPSEDELCRARTHGVIPEQRFHFRYEAAALAWEAASLLSDNSDLTARVLCIAGSWLKNRDPDTADVFYKSLVRRCRKTDIGKLADRMRWFPELDDNGNPIPRQPEPPSEIAPEADAAEKSAEQSAGFWYVLHRGNTLQDVAAAVGAIHRFAIAAEEIQRANPTASPNRLKAGQKIFVPAPGTR